MYQVMLCTLFHYDMHSDNEMMCIVCNDALLNVCNDALFNTVYILSLNDVHRYIMMHYYLYVTMHYFILCTSFHYKVRSDNEMMCVVCNEALLNSICNMM